MHHKKSVTDFSVRFFFRLIKNNAKPLPLMISGLSVIKQPTIAFGGLETFKYRFISKTTSH